MKNSEITLLCGLDLFTIGTTVTELGNLDAMRVIGSQVVMAKAVFNCKGKMSVVTIMDSRAKPAIRIL